MPRLTGHKTVQVATTLHAPPEEGSRRWRIRGCTGVFTLLVGVGSALASNLLPVPSGQPVELSDVLLDTNPGELWVRFRFIAPKIGSTAGRITYDVAVVDMEHLCETLAVPYVAQHELQPARIVISFSDRPVAFGTSEPDATQFFEAYRLDQSRCIWEGL